MKVYYKNLPPDPFWLVAPHAQGVRSNSIQVVVLYVVCLESYLSARTEWAGLGLEGVLIHVAVRLTMYVSFVFL